MDYNCGVYFPKTGRGYVSFVDPADDTWIERHLQNEQTSGSTSDWTEFNTAANRRPLPQTMLSSAPREESTPSFDGMGRRIQSDNMNQRRPQQRFASESRDQYSAARRPFPKSFSSGLDPPTSFPHAAQGTRRFSSATQDTTSVPDRRPRFPPCMMSSFPNPSAHKMPLPESLFSTLPDHVSDRSKDKKNIREGKGSSANDTEPVPSLDRASRRAILENVFLGQPLSSPTFTPSSPPADKKHKFNIRFPIPKHFPIPQSKQQKQQQQQQQQQQKEKLKKQPPKKHSNGHAMKSHVSEHNKVTKRPRQSLFAKVCFHCGTSKMAASSNQISWPLGSHRDSRASSNWSRLDLENYGYDGIYGDIEGSGIHRHHHRPAWRAKKPEINVKSMTCIIIIKKPNTDYNHLIFPSQGFTTDKSRHLTLRARIDIALASSAH
ncbi:hypothetical protein PoB_005742100 [Plakobranchus ocellatus]|uniref:Uncharacterized protein n=1 Tax=Plakobranchus ocellatus TaxID=259542 RepID=A0AAV4CHK4_9GAST|nr:hypothetical protein PoB_005742100 [Plakobranchus ocellatus]